MAGFARMRALVSACASIAARLFDRQSLASAYCAAQILQCGRCHGGHAVRHSFLSDRAFRIMQCHQRSFVSRVQHHVAARRIGHLRIITEVFAEGERFLKLKNSFLAERFSDSVLCQCSQCLIVIAGRIAFVMVDVKFASGNLFETRRDVKDLLRHILTNRVKV